MKSAVMAVMLALAATAALGQDLEGLKAIYARKCKENVEAYGKALDAAMEALKAKGDLEGFLAVESEKKRFEASGTVAPSNSPPAVAKAKAGYEAASVALLRMYVPALDRAVRDAVRAGNLDEAKALKEEMDRAEFEMADVKSKTPKAPKEEAAAGTNVPAKDAPAMKFRDFLVVKATYGAEGRTIDVTKKLKGMTKKGKIGIEVPSDLSGGWVYDNLFGDPAPQTPKTLKVTYRYGGKELEVSLSQNESLSIPQEDGLELGEGAPLAKKVPSLAGAWTDGWAPDFVRKLKQTGDKLSFWTKEEGKGEGTVDKDGAVTIRGANTKEGWVFEAKLSSDGKRLSGRVTWDSGNSADWWWVRGK